jgi:hypothetical protein
MMRDAWCTCSKLDGRVGDEGTKTGARAWQGISDGAGKHDNSCIRDCILLTSDGAGKHDN